MTGSALLIALAGALVAAVVALGRLARSADPKRGWSEREFERRRARRGSGLLAASMRVLGEQLDSGARGAAEEREAERSGARPEEAHPGEPPTPG